MRLGMILGLLSIIILIGHTPTTKAQLYKCSICESYGSYQPSNQVTTISRTATFCVDPNGKYVEISPGSASSCSCVVVVGFVVETCTVGGKPYTNVTINSIRYNCPEFAVRQQGENMDNIIFGLLLNGLDLFSVRQNVETKVNISYPSCTFEQASISYSGHTHIVACDPDGRCCSKGFEIKLVDCRYHSSFFGWTPGGTEWCNQYAPVVPIPGEGVIIRPCSESCGYERKYY